MPKLATKSILSLALLAALLLSIAGIVIPQTASAWTASGSGHFGSSTVPHFQAVVHPFAEPQAVIPARTVHRVPRYSGTQKITVYWTVYQWQGTSRNYTFTPFTGTSRTAYVGPGRQVTFTARQFGLTSFFSYTFELTTVWRNSRGALIGRRVIHYVNPSDYQCFTSGDTTCQIQTLGGRSAVYVTDLGLTP